MIKTTRTGVTYKEVNGEVVAKKCSKCDTLKSLNEFNKDKKKFAGRRGECKACRKPQTKKTYDNSKDRYKRYYEDNKDYIKSYRKKNYDSTSLEERKKKRRTQYLNRKSKNLAEQKLYYEQNKDKFFEKVRKRRTLEKNLPYTLKPKDHAYLLEVQGGKCLLTGETENLHIEHFIPLHSGHGGTTFENCYYMEGVLNGSKTYLNPFVWIQTQPKNIQERFYTKLVPMMAERNKMNIEEFENYVNSCFEDTNGDAV